MGKTFVVNIETGGYAAYEREKYLKEPPPQFNSSVCS
jgi:hypothetical protein